MVAMMSEVKKTPNKLFVERMEREGRGKELRARIKALMEDGLYWSQAQRQANKEFGYVGAKEERALAAEYEVSKRKEIEREILGEVREEVRAKTFEDAIELVTKTTSPAAEIEWIRAHPAMSRLDRQKDKTKPVQITADDILYAPHGPAPSRSAVNQLIHWANRPGEFYKQILAEHRKRVESGDDTQGSMADPGIGDVQVYLAQIKAMVNHGEQDERRRGEFGVGGNG